MGRTEYTNHLFKQACVLAVQERKMTNIYRPPSDAAESVFLILTEHTNLLVQFANET